MAKKIWLGMLAVAMAFGMTVIGCERTEQREAAPTELEALGAELEAMLEAIGEEAEATIEALFGENGEDEAGEAELETPQDDS